MRYDVGRFRRPMRRSTEGQLMSLISLGDGSTLTLDFTTGVLDSRLTFTRTSNATFINSSGLVQWAASNHAPRTNWNFTSPAGSGWNAATTSGTGTFQWVGDGTVIASSGSSGQAFTSITTSTGIAEGLRYVMSVTAQSVTGSPTIQSIFDMTNASGNTYFKNGATATAGTTVASGDRISVSAVATATTMNVRMGCGAWFANRTNESVTLTQFHWHPGSSPVPYYENTATSPRYDSARFDHDPTTGAPRGLLIEGTATNLFNWSETFDTTGGATNWNWSVNVTRGTVTTTNPTGASATVIKVEETTTNGLHAPLTVPTVLASTTYTFSVWAKAVERTFVQLWENGGSGANSMVNLSTGAIVSESTAGITTVTAFGSTGWYRISMRLTTIVGQTTANCQLRLSTNGTTTSYAGTTGSGIYIWGAQLEAGSGASSYIPTGASTVQRLADFCYMANADYGFSTSGGTYLAEWHRGSNITTGSTSNNAFATDYASGRWLGVYTTGASSTGTAGSWSGYLNSSGAVSGINRMAVSYSSWVASASGNASLNGGAIVSGTLTLGTTPTYLFVGAASGTAPYSGAGYRDPLNNCVRRIKYWPNVLPNAQLQSLTT